MFGSLELPGVYDRLLPVTLKLEWLSNFPLERGSFNGDDIMLLAKPHRIGFETQQVESIRPFMKQNRCVGTAYDFTLAGLTECQADVIWLGIDYLGRGHSLAVDPT
jgi:hypothetical protein